MLNKPYIPIVELHFSNTCTGRCVICSDAHGYDSFPYCTEDVFKHIITNLKTVDFGVIQVGGDGDSFLNPYFFEALRLLRKNFPDKPLTLFTNGFMLTPSNSDVIIKERLLDNVETRIDTINPVLFKQSTGLDFNVVSNNIGYFMSKSADIKTHIIYFPLFIYEQCVREYLDKEPTDFYKIDKGLLKNEYLLVYTHFKSKVVKGPFNFRISEICLWGEREDAFINTETVCSQLNGAFKNQVYIYPNGNYGLCPFDDGQDTFVFGNVATDNLAEAYVGGKRKQYIQDITDMKYAGKGCCINPKACYSYDYYRNNVGVYSGIL